MTRPFLPNWKRPALQAAAVANRKTGLRWFAPDGALVFTLAALVTGGMAAAQVMTIDTSNNAPVAAGPVDRQYAQIEPTHVALPDSRLDDKTAMMLIRTMQAEQGFAMRPFPRGHKGLKLEANGKLDPAGQNYVKMAVSDGIAARPGDRVVVTDMKINRSSIVFELNGGPDLKHRILSHIQIGMDPTMTAPVVQQNGDVPTGARLTLAFKGQIPELTSKQVKDLLAPLISFDVKTPVQAYTDTLPKPLKEAILNHQVLVGMSTQMVLYAMGRPWNKYRDIEGQMPYEVWLYGHPPKTTTFVSINGNRVIRVVIGQAGKPLEVFTQDVVSPMMLSTGSGELAASNVHVIKEGDVQRNPNTEAPAPPPTLLKPGEQAPDAVQGAGQMKPVHFPKDQQEPTLGANPDDQQPTAPPAATQSAPAKGTQPAAGAKPANGNQTTPAKSGSQPSTQEGSGPSN